MERMNEFIINRYMTIDRRIEQLQWKKKYKRWAFYQQTFCTTTAYTGYEVVAQAIKTDKAIEKLDETLRLIDHQLEILKMKQGFWHKFITLLSSKEQQYFHDKYIKGYICTNEHLERLAMEEIDEIGQAIAMCYCTKQEYQEPIKLVENDFMGNIDRVLEAVGV